MWHKVTVRLKTGSENRIIPFQQCWSHTEVWVTMATPSRVVTGEVGVYLDWGVGVGGAGGKRAVFALGIEGGGRRGGELREVLS